MEGPNGTVGHIPSSPTKGAAAGLVRIIGSLLLVARMVGLCLPENSEGFAAVARWEFYTSRGSTFFGGPPNERNRTLILKGF